MLGQLPGDCVDRFLFSTDNCSQVVDRDKDSRVLAVFNARVTLCDPCCISCESPSFLLFLFRTAPPSPPSSSCAPLQRRCQRYFCTSSLCSTLIHSTTCTSPSLFLSAFLFCSYRPFFTKQSLHFSTTPFSKIFSSSTFFPSFPFHHTHFSSF